MSRETDLAWAAGFFDGEGTVGLWKNNNGRGTQSKRLTAAISQNDKATLQRFADIVGGTVLGPYVGSNTSKEHWRSMYGGVTVVKLYNLLKPYLVFKGVQFERAIGEWRAFRAAFVLKKPGPGGISK